jgi:hypothetical protein
MLVGTRHARTTWILAAFFLTAVLLVVPSVSAQDYAAAIVSRHVLTNEGVITLAKAGFDELFIVERIRTSRAKFDASEAALVALKQAGVSEDVIRLIAQRDNLDYKRQVGLSYYAPPGATVATAGAIENWPPAQPISHAPHAPPTPIVTEKRWWVFHWIRVSY